MRLWPTRIAFILCLGVAGALAVRTARTELAEPPSFGRADLQAWLEAEVPDPTVAVVRRAARQLDRDFHAGFDWQPIVETLPPERQDPFAAHFQTLLMVLLEQRADAYRATPSRHRETYLDGQLLDLQTWYAVGPQGRTGGLALFAKLLNAAWTPGANVQSGKVLEFISALQSRVVARSLNRARPDDDMPHERDE